MAKRQIEDTVSVVVEGRQYTAKRVITGTRYPLTQAITFDGHTAADSYDYQPGREAEMRSTAESMLRKLVTHGPLGGTPLGRTPSDP